MLATATLTRTDPVRWADPGPDEIAVADSLRQWCPHVPTPKQAAFLATTAFEAMYGGAAGGGKSDALLMGAVMYVHVPAYAALLLRRSYADLALPGAIMDRSHEWWDGTAARWSDKDKTWHFPTGATVTFGYLQTARDHYRYQGAELQYVGFDELTQFPEVPYTYLLSRLRRLAGSSVPLRARSASNPGGVGHEWVKRRFVSKKTRDGRRFVPARLIDNPHLDTAEYEDALARLDPVTRQQLRDGDWDVVMDGGMFKREWFDERYNPDVLPHFGMVFITVDSAFSERTTADRSAICVWGVTKTHLYLLDVWKDRVAYPDLLRAIMDVHEKWRIKLDRGIWVYIENKASGQSAIQSLQRGSRMPVQPFEPGSASKISRAQDSTPYCAARRLLLPQDASWASDWVQEHVDFPAEGRYDDQVDNTSMATKIFASAGGRPPGSEDFQGEDDDSDDQADDR